MAYQPDLEQPRIEGRELAYASCLKMSALGQSGHVGACIGMSALPPKADTQSSSFRMSAKCHKRTSWSELFGSPAGGYGPNLNCTFSAMGPTMLRRSLELVLVVGAARCEQLLGAAKGLVDILLEIIRKEGEGPDKPGEVLL